MFDRLSVILELSCLDSRSKLMSSTGVEQCYFQNVWINVSLQLLSILAKEVVICLFFGLSLLLFEAHLVLAIMAL